MSGVSNIAREAFGLSPAFKPWPKISRQAVWMRVTEKIDGTNAAVVVQDGQVYAQSRKRLIFPGNDNFGFAAWCQEHAAELLELGEGHHFGEWYGQGIQRGYGLDHKRFALFGHWYRDQRTDALSAHAGLPPCVDLVPELYRGSPHAPTLNTGWAYALEAGSVAVPGFDDPEGFVVEYVTGRDILRQKVIISEWRGGKEATRG